MRGLLWDHPTVSPQLLRRKQVLMKRRAGTKVSTMLQSRPRRQDLVDRNILLKEDETLDTRRRHKRKASQTLDSKLQRRPKLMEEEEARRQRHRSMNDSDFRPDYLQHILANEEDDDIPQRVEMQIRFLNVGGYVIPFVSPTFMSALAGDGHHDDGSAQRQQQSAEQQQVEVMEHRVETLQDRLDDVEQELEQNKVSLRRKMEQIQRLKGENANLKKLSSRKSLAADTDQIKMVRKQQEDAVKLDRLERDIAAKEDYIERLAFYLKEQEDLELPTPQQLREQRAALKNKLDFNLKRRPSAETLQQKAILSSSFSEDATNQTVQIAERTLKFRRTSQVIERFLERRPSVERLKERNQNLFAFDVAGAAMAGSDGSEYEEIPSMHIEDNATKKELRQEVLRLHAMLAEKVVINNKYRKENETMKSKILESLDSGTESMGRGLKQHSLMETQVLNQTFVDLSKEADDKKINELEQNLTVKTQQIEKLQQKIRRLSTVDHFEFEREREGDEIQRLFEWSRTLSWPEGVEQVFESWQFGDNCYRLLQTVMTEERRISKKEHFEREQSHSEQVRSLQSTIEELRSNTDRITVLEEELRRIRSEHLRDKQRFAMNTAEELDRLRTQLKNMGRAQQLRQQSQYSYLSTVSSLLWNSSSPSTSAHK